SFKATMNAAGGRMLLTQPLAQIVVLMFFCVTAGLSTPGVRFGSGRPSAWEAAESSSHDASNMPYLIGVPLHDSARPDGKIRTAPGGGSSTVFQTLRARGGGPFPSESSN